MSTLEETISKLCEEGEIPGVLLLARSSSSDLHYEQAFGHSSADGKPLSTDTILRMASCSKLVTTVCALQCVERGLIGLDDDVMSVLPELNDVQLLRSVIRGFEDGQPVLEARKGTITLRQLLSHSSGICVDALSPLLRKWRQSRSEEIWARGDTIEDCFTYPATYEPGMEWSYGPSLDWTGRLIDRINGGISLDDYMQDNICRPLGITDLTFYLQERPDMLAKHAEMSDRDPGSKITHYVKADYYEKDPKECFGGSGIYTSARSYMKILYSLVSDDNKLLNSSTLQSCFESQLSDSAQASLMRYLKYPIISGVVPLGLQASHGLGGLLTMEDVPGWWKKGTLTWSGRPNLYWFIDRESGICALYASQVRPFSDKKSIELCTLFFRTMYERMATQ